MVPSASLGEEARAARRGDGLPGKGRVVQPEEGTKEPFASGNKRGVHAHNAGETPGGANSSRGDNEKKPGTSEPWTQRKWMGWSSREESPRLLY